MDRPEGAASGNGLGFVAAGRVSRVHGVRGRLRVIPSMESPEDSLPGKEVFVYGQSIPEPGAPGWRAYRVESAVKSGRAVLIKLQGLDSRTDAEPLRGSFLFVAVADLPDLSSDSYYFHRLCRMAAHSETGGRIGLIKDVWETPAHPVLVVESDSGQEILIPFLRTFISEIDEDRGRVVVTEAPGLFEPT